MKNKKICRALSKLDWEIYYFENTYYCDHIQKKGIKEDIDYAREHLEILGMILSRIEKNLEGGRE